MSKNTLLPFCECIAFGIRFLHNHWLCLSMTLHSFVTVHLTLVHLVIILSVDHQMPVQIEIAIIRSSCVLVIYSWPSTTDDLQVVVNRPWWPCLMERASSSLLIDFQLLPVVLHLRLLACKLISLKPGREWVPRPAVSLLGQQLCIQVSQCIVQMLLYGHVWLRPHEKALVLAALGARVDLLSRPWVDICTVWHLLDACICPCSILLQVLVCSDRSANIQSTS